MCSLCGALGARDHWTDPVARPGVFAPNTDAASRRRERAARVRLANRALLPFRLTLADWQGTAFLLSTATGRTELIDDLGHLWPAAETLLGRPCDPLDPALLAALEAGDG